MKVCTLASGSSGNSLYIETMHSKILVDAGISLRQIKLRLGSIGVDVTDLDAVIISHEHSDHSHAINRLDLPVYISEATTDLWQDSVKQIYEFDSETAFEINDLLVTPFSVPHDAVDPVGFTVEDGQKKIGIATDIGSVTGLVTEKLKGANMLIVESNHDSDTLMNSKYPWQLKQRIKSRLGHLSNIQSAELLEKVYNPELRNIVLAHLSMVNNSPDIAYRTSHSVLQANGGEHITLSVAPRNTIGEVISV